MTIVEFEEQPLIPTWARSREELADNTRKLVKRTTHGALWHTRNLPLYVAKLAGMSPRGLGRTVAAVWRLVFDHESRGMRLHHAGRLESKEYLALRKTRDQRVKNRMIVAAVLALPLLTAGIVGYFLLPTWTLYTIGGCAVLLFGWVGRPAGKQITKPATLVQGAPGPLKAPFVMDALCSLGIGGMKNPDDIGLLFDVAREGPGYQCDLELPRGVDATAVLEKRSQLSAALRRELGTVWPSVGKRHQGHLVLYVSDEPMATARQTPWPLLKSGTTNLFSDIPLFTDQRGKWICQNLAYTSGIIGSVPRVGKTFALRELLLVAGLDPRALVYAIDLKGNGDLAPCALFAHFYSVGDEDDQITEQLDAMRGLRQEMRRRAKILRSLSHEECPENKVTSALADRRELGLEPIFCGVDEVQFWMQHEDKAIRQEFEMICTDLVKRGPAAGIMCYFATQKPDARSLPTNIADNAVIRLCFKVTGQPSNDQILGTSSYQSGLRATMFGFEDKGVAYLKSDGADAQIVRTVVGLDAPTAERVAARARQVRQTAARLTGMAAGEDMAAEVEQVALLTDVRQVLTTPAAHLADLVTMLASLRPELYGHLDAQALGSMLRTAGVPVGTVWDSSKPRDVAGGKGVKREWLDQVSATSALGDEAEEAQARRLQLVRKSG